MVALKGRLRGDPRGVIQAQTVVIDELIVRFARSQDHSDQAPVLSPRPESLLALRTDLGRLAGRGSALPSALARFCTRGYQLATCTVPLVEASAASQHDDDGDAITRPGRATADPTQRRKSWQQERVPPAVTFAR